jgi:hypothetical protein
MRLRQSSLLCANALALLVVADCGCGKPSTQSSKTSDRQAGSNAGAPADAAAPRDDSFTTEEYVHLGLPAPDKAWSADDMAKAAEVLGAIAQQGYQHLPRYKSKRSGEMFARLTSPQNLDFFKNRSLPLGSRMPPLLDFGQANTHIFKLYLPGFVNKEIRDTEIVELWGAQLRSTTMMLELLDEFLPTITKDDPKYQVRMRGLDRVKRGLAEVVAGGLQTLTERATYRTRELVKLIGFEEVSFPLIVPRLLPADRTATLAQLDKLQNDTTLIDLQPSLGVLRLKVKDAVEQAEAPKKTPRG